MKNDNTVLIIVVAILAVLLFGGFGMAPFYGGHMTNWFSGNTFFWPMMLFGIIIWLLIIVVLMLGIVWLVRQLNGDK